MTQRSRELLEKALSLSEEERAELAASAPTLKTATTGLQPLRTPHPSENS